MLCLYGTGEQNGQQCFAWVERRETYYILMISLPLEGFPISSRDYLIVTEHIFEVLYVRCNFFCRSTLNVHMMRNAKWTFLTEGFVNDVGYGNALR